MAEQKDNKIILTEKEYRMYLAFRENYEKFNAIFNGGVFTLQEGKAEINCHNNQIQSVVIHKRTYKRAADM